MRWREGGSNWRNGPTVTRGIPHTLSGIPPLFRPLSAMWVLSRRVEDGYAQFTILTERGLTSFGILNYVVTVYVFCGECLQCRH